VLNSDETGWRSDGERRYLWALVARMFVFYTVAQTRSSEVLVHLLGAVFAGILCSDRYSGYFKYQKGQAQLCWAHLKRDILGIQDFAKTTEAERFARDALALYASLFRLWRKFQSHLITRDQLVQRSLRLQKGWFALAERHLDSEDRAVRNLAIALYQHCDRLFTFLQYPGVEPTNNAAERALRIAVQWRKTSFGNRSALGEIATARLLTVSQTGPIPLDLFPVRDVNCYVLSHLGNHRKGEPENHENAGPLRLRSGQVFDSLRSLSDCLFSQGKICGRVMEKTAQGRASENDGAVFRFPTTPTAADDIN
jgi:transposase